ncbi:MAG: AEC family transporter [Candidatus Cloacimonetes bacterium]|nr:AEC family transporter [Candidatus Cloacimonadota bacterium]
MPNNWFVLLNPISFLGILVLIGYISEKCKYVANIRENLSKTIVHITLPLLVITALCSQNIEDICFTDAIIVFFSAIFCVSALLCINHLVARLLKIPENRRVIHTLLGSFGNVIYLGFPVVLHLFGETGLLYAIIFSMGNDLLVWTYAVHKLDKERCKNAETVGIRQAKWNLRYLINPNTLSFLIGISLLLLGLKIPEILYKPLHSLGQATVPLSMLFIGAILARTELIKSIKQASIWSIVFIKMLLFPMLLLLAFRYVLSFVGLDVMLESSKTLLFAVVNTQVAMPTQINLSVLSEKYQNDTEYVAQTIFCTTLCSAFTLPAVLLFAMSI